MVAGIAVALARGEDPVTATRLGSAAGAATAASGGTALGTAEDVARLLAGVQVQMLG